MPCEEKSFDDIPDNCDDVAVSAVACGSGVACRLEGDPVAAVAVAERADAALAAALVVQAEAEAALVSALDAERLAGVVGPDAHGGCFAAEVALGHLKEATGKAVVSKRATAVAAVEGVLRLQNTA